MIFYGLGIGSLLFFFKKLSTSPGNIMQGIIGTKKWKTADKKSEIKLINII